MFVSLCIGALTLVEFDFFKINIKFNDFKIQTINLKYLVFLFGLIKINIEL